MHRFRFVLFFCIVSFILACFSVSCAPSEAETSGLGVRIQATITQGQLDSIRSFRILAFDQGIYKCNIATHRVMYGRVGYASSYSFNWTSEEQKVPTSRLYLPSSAIGKKWVIQVEAYSVTQHSQPITKMQGETEIITEIVAQGCINGIQFLNGEEPVPISIELFSRN